MIKVIIETRKYWNKNGYIQSKGKVTNTLTGEQIEINDIHDHVNIGLAQRFFSDITYSEIYSVTYSVQTKKEL